MFRSIKKLYTAIKEAAAQPVRTYEDYRALVDPFLKLYVKRLLVESSPPLEEILKAHPRLVIVQSHGPALGPLAYTFLLCRFMCDAGGGDRKPIAVTHRLFYKFPVLDRVATYLTQVAEPVSFDGFLARFKSGQYSDFCLMPEGDHCNFGNGLDIMPFKSTRFVEIAIRSGAPILVVAQRGAEVWGRTVSISESICDFLSKFLPDAIVQPMRTANTINMPWLTQRLATVKVKIALFQPPLLYDRQLTKREYKVEVNRVAEEIRALMQSLVNNIPSDDYNNILV